MQNIKNLLDNPTFNQIDEPVALFFTYADIDRYEYYEKNHQELVNLHNCNQQALIEYLDGLNYTVVSEKNTLAANPATIVVTNTGIQTPFIEKEFANEFALDFANMIDKSGIVKPRSKIFAIRLGQLPPPVLHPQEEKTMFTLLQHPDGRMLDYIKNRYGKNFIEEQYKKAWREGLDSEIRKNKEYDPADLTQELYSGRKFTISPFYSYPRNSLESRFQVFAAPNYNHAALFCGQGELFGLIHHFSKMPNQQYFKNFGLELADVSQTSPSQQLETAIVPGLNKYLGLEMYMGSRYYDIPEEDERWIVFKEFLRASYITENEIMKQRRLNILCDAKNNGGVATCYVPMGIKAQDLLDNTYPQKLDLDLEDVLIEKPTPIRQEFNQYLRQSIDNMHDKVKEIKQSATQTASKTNTDVKNELYKIKTGFYAK